jgi:hypothetical protein
MSTCPSFLAAGSPNGVGRRVRQPLDSIRSEHGEGVFHEPLRKITNVSSRYEGSRNSQATAVTSSRRCEPRAGSG